MSRFEKKSLNKSLEGKNFGETSCGSGIELFNARWLP